MGYYHRLELGSDSWIDEEEIVNREKLFYIIEDEKVGHVFPYELGRGLFIGALDDEFKNYSDWFEKFISRILREGAVRLNRSRQYMLISEDNESDRLLVLESDMNRLMVEDIEWIAVYSKPWEFI